MYNIYGEYKGTNCRVTELLEEAVDYDQAIKLVAEYRVSLGSKWTIWFAVNKY